MNTNNILSKLVRQAQLGHRPSISRLAQLAQDRLSPYLYRVTLDHNLTQDLLQETLLSLIKNIHQLQNPNRFWPWIYRIACSKTQQHYQKQLRRPALSLSSLDYDLAYNLSAKNNQSPLNIIMHREKLSRLRAAIQKLKYPYRFVINLRCFQHLPYHQIAPRAHCTIPNARLNFHRAKLSLKTKLLPH